MQCNPGAFDSQDKLYSQRFACCVPVTTLTCVHVHALSASIVQRVSSKHALTSRKQVVDEGKKRAIQLEKEGFPDAVVWNPWIKKAAGMADFGDKEYKVKSLPTITHVIQGSTDVIQRRGARLLARSASCQV